MLPLCLFLWRWWFPDGTFETINIETLKADLEEQKTDNETKEE